MSVETRRILISGANGGLGLSAVTFLIKEGYTVFALDIATGCLDTLSASLPAEGDDNHGGKLIILKADLTDSASLQNAFTEVEKHTESLDVVISIAGNMAIGSLVEQDAELMQKVINVTFMGCVRLYKAFFPLVEKAGGRFITITSEYAVLDSLPFHGFYTAAKHALKAYSDSLRRELQFLNIKVVEVRPGAFATPMQGGIQDRFAHILNDTKHYKLQLTKMKAMMDKELLKAKDPAIFVKTLYKAVSSKHPKRCYCVHNSFKMRCLSVLPAAMQDKILKLLFS